MDFVLDFNLEESSFVEACVRNERWAQQKLYEVFYPSVMPLCKRYSNNSDEAIDIMHEGFIKVFKNISKYKVGTSLNSWIKRIMINTAIDHYRKMSRRRTEDLDTAYTVFSKDPDVVSTMTADEILSCLHKLTPAYRTVFNLYVIEGYSHKEIADVMGITESTSRSNLVKSRKKLQELLLSKGMNYGKK